ncbi:hypothetical protein GQ44DRAFT_818169 [Phaeosphaeriaceae sp. PMI808]|nr:hypothetical protein GQ44DRAFT_818169 [Phaeosphaeriaceae sp. PMI808]
MAREGERREEVLGRSIHAIQGPWRQAKCQRLESCNVFILTNYEIKTPSPPLLDAEFIKDYPFPSLELKSLRATPRPRDEETSSASSNETIDLSTSRDAISKLLAILLIHPIAKRLKSTTRRPLNSQLASIPLRPPSPSPFEEHSSILRRHAIHPLVSVTPGHRPDATGSGAAVAQGAGHLHLYKEWCSEASEIYHNVCEDNGGDPLKGFPGMHSEDKIWAWLDDFQNKCLTDSSGKHFRTTRKGQTATAAERQLDLFIKPRDTPEKEKHNMVCCGRHCGAAISYSNVKLAGVLAYEMRAAI